MLLSKSTSILLLSRNIPQKQKDKKPNDNRKRQKPADINTPFSQFEQLFPGLFRGLC
jgi:hypothetical protein